MGVTNSLMDRHGNRNIRFALLICLVGFLGLDALIRQPYQVVDAEGECAFEIQPTSWNDGDIVPCGTTIPRFTTPLEGFNGER
jgi:hypothetical protein